ncbi:mucin-3B-like [Rana temporaria]|uniref:mucin-3B-like n=1 Tax=Rana temporaria TaxID=8407 RepID=UPI001AAD24FB|nr:mucin-3B-like [Rana temporaria]
MCYQLSLLQKGTTTPTFLRTTTGIGTTLPTDTAKVLTYIPTSPEIKENTGTKYETTNTPSTTPTTTKPTTTTVPAIKTSTIGKGSCEHIPNNLKQFHTLMRISGVLRCVSDCDPVSPYHFNCSSGSCNILRTGPRCLCPETDLYIYTDDRCGGRISKLGLFIGVGVAFAVLLGVTITLGIYLYKTKRQAAQQKDSFYQSIE